MHIISNMWALWIFGDNVEDRMGRYDLLIFTCVQRLAAMTHVLAVPDSTCRPSGVGSHRGRARRIFIVISDRADCRLFPVFFSVFFELPAVFYLGLWFSKPVVQRSARVGG